LGPRDYGATTGVEIGHLVRTLAIRGIAVGAMGALAFMIGRSMVNDLMEEVRAGIL
jgi:hypothetical protein